MSPDAEDNDAPAPCCGQHGACPRPLLPEDVFCAEHRDSANEDAWHDQLASYYDGDAPPTEEERYQEAARIRFAR